MLILLVLWCFIDPLYGCTQEKKLPSVFSAILTCCQILSHYMKSHSGKHKTVHICQRCCELEIDETVSYTIFCARKLNVGFRTNLNTKQAFLH